MSTVLYVCEYASLNGGERSLLAVLDGVRQNGFRVRAAAPGAGPLAEALAAIDVELLPLEWNDAHGARLTRSQMETQVSRLITESGADLVHANSLSMGRLVGPAARALGTPSVGSLRDIMNISRKAATDLNLHKRLLAVSCAARNWYQSRGVSSDKMHVLHNGVDLERFQPRAATGYLHDELKLPPDAPLIGAIGQIGLRKGTDVFLESARSLPKRAHFLIIGRRHSQKAESLQFERQLHVFASQHPLSGRVHFVGERQDVHRLLPELALLVHAARQEPLGRVLLEAAACGTAIVATGVGGTREIFPAASAAACVVPANAPAAMAAAAAELLDDEDRRRSLGAAARQRAVQAFDARRASEALVGHYQAVLAGR